MKSPKIWLVAFLGFACAGCGEKPFADYNSPGGRFKVLFPGAPKTQSVAAKAGVNVTVYSVESFFWGYVVTHYDLPAGANNIPVDALKQTLNAEIDGMFTGAQGQKASSKPVRAQNNHDGMEYEGVWKKPKTMNVRGRTFIVNNRVFNVVVAGSAEKVNSDIATKFLDSFQPN
jgi:hypothetical protein